MRKKGKGAYVYAIFVDDVVRYIGKGRTYRLGQHMTMVRSIARRRAAGESVNTSYLYNKLTKAWLAGAEIQEVFIAEEMTDDDAYAREIAEITAAPKGQLWNFWPGGEGGSKGYLKSAEQRRKIAESNRKTWTDPKLLAEHSETSKLLWLRPEYRERLTGRKWTPEMRAALSAKRKAQWADLEFRAKMKQSFSTAEYTKRQSERITKQWADPEWRAKMIAAQIKGRKT